MKLENFSNYEIYPEEGKIWSYKSKRYVGAQVTNGYWQVGLYDDNGERHMFQLHRVIWMAVNGDIPEGLEINHIDENKSNNSISNLNLMTRKENINYGTGIQRSAKKQTNRSDISKQVGAFKDGVLVMVFPSTREAGRNGFKHSAVSNCCNGKLPHYKGYQWKYIN
jgi:hypothetical protein